MCPPVVHVLNTEREALRLEPSVRGCGSRSVSGTGQHLPKRAGVALGRKSSSSGFGVKIGKEGLPHRRVRLWLPLPLPCPDLSLLLPFPAPQRCCLPDLLLAVPWLPLGAGQAAPLGLAHPPRTRGDPLRTASPRLEAGSQSGIRWWEAMVSGGLGRKTERERERRTKIKWQEEKQRGRTSETQTELASGRQRLRSSEGETGQV